MIEVHTEGIQRISVYLERLDEKIWRAAKAVVARQSKAMTKYVIARHLTGGTSKDRLAVRTGHLRRTTKAKPVKEEKGAIVGGTSFGAKYARVHVGPRGKKTTITPKRAKYLAIPLAAAKTPAGVARGGPRDFPDTFVFRSKAGNLIIGQRRRDRVVPLFVLKKRVTIPTRVHPEDIARVFTPRVLKDLRTSFERAAG